MPSTAAPRRCLLTAALAGMEPAPSCAGWICGFSSTHSTRARSGGFRYRPTTSRTFSTKAGSVESLKVLHPVRPQAKRPPDPAHGGLAHPDLPGHRARAPVGGIGRLLLQSDRDQALHGLVVNPSWRTGTWRIHQTLQPMLGKAPTPQGYRRPTYTQRLGYPKIGGLRLSTSKHHTVLLPPKDRARCAKA